MKLQHGAAIAHAVKLVCLILMLVLMLIPSISVYTVETDGNNLSALSIFIKPVNERSEEYKGNENAFVLNVPQLALEMWEQADAYKEMGEEMDQISPPPTATGEEPTTPADLSAEDAKFHEDMRFNRAFMATAQFLCRIVSILMYAAFLLLCLEILISALHLLFTLHPALVWVKKTNPISRFFWAGGLFVSYVVCILFQFAILGAQNATLNTLEASYRVQLVLQGVHFALLWAIVFALYVVLAIVLRRVTAPKAPALESAQEAAAEETAVAEEATV
ncbi:MAG: hypothetical protein IJW29_03980 [Clostridia bacterium]|nr:hypothetical protein [Clostridia bacterium]